MTTQEHDSSSNGQSDSGISATTIDELRDIAGLYPQSGSALLPMLHLIQSVEGRVTNEGIEICAEILDISAAEVAGVTTFYTMYKRHPVGDYHVGVCTNTLCAVMGGDEIFDRLKDHLDVGNDEMTEDGKITLEHIECNAACDYAPVMMINWEFFDNQTPESATTIVDDLREGKKVCASRGATITKWREAERVLAGYEDGRVDEGPAAGEPSLAGLRIAAEEGWTAPARDEASSNVDEDVKSATGAAQEADTSRAESETELDESPADTARKASDD